MRQKILIILLLITQNSHQVVRDASFIRFCDNAGGQLVKQAQPQPTTPGIQYSRGDMCTVTLPFPAATQEEAEDYCQSWNMYPIDEAKLSRDGNPECKYENVFECKPDYTLIKGYCYKMVSTKFVTYEDAKTLCSNEKVTSIIDDSKKLSVQVVKMYDQDLIRFFKAYFENMGMFFIQNIPEMIANLKIEYNGDGDDYALAFGMAPIYKTGQGAVIRLPKETKARVMCVYEPEETPMSLSYKARKLAPYYYPTADNGQVWRTAGQYGIQDTDYRWASASKMCEASMRALVGKNKGDAWDASIINVNKLDDTFKLSFVKILLSYSYCCIKKRDDWTEELFTSSCDLAYYYYYFYAVTIRTIYNYDKKCLELPATNDVSHSIPHSVYQYPATYFYYPTKVGSYHIANSQKYNVRAPALCNLHYFIPPKPKSCEQGWTPFTRDNGLTICHKVFHSDKRSFDASLDFCHKKGGTLTTFTSDKEYRFLMDLFGNGGGVWLGYKKKYECPLVNTYGRCTSSYIFEFVDPRFGDDTYSARQAMSRQWLPGEPNNMYKSEHCIHKWEQGSGQRPLINDIFCSHSHSPACIKAQT